MKNNVIIACDFSSQIDLFNFLDKFPEKPFIKIGMELFYKEGASLVKRLKEMGCYIFLDLKLHDIPNTVYKAMKNLGALGVDIVNVHAAGGVEMMKSAKKALLETSEKTLLIAVTQLTSIDQNALENELLIEKKLDDVVRQYALNAKNAGLDGVVCSPLEAPIIKELGLISVTPGIRLDSNVQDQKRVTTPIIARELGSNFIVVGRPITESCYPYETYKLIKEDFLK